MRKLITTIALVAVGVTACGGSVAGSSIHDLAAMQEKLEAAGFDCPKGPQSPEPSDVDFDGIEDPIEELDCEDGEDTITAVRWEDAKTRNASMNMVGILLCGFGGMSDITFVADNSWAVTTAVFEDSSDASTDVIERVAEALEVSPTAKKCDSSDIPDKSPADDREDASTTTSTPSTTVPSKGSKAEPLAVGEEMRLGDFDVTVTEIVADATEEVQGANQFNDPPEKGQFAKVVLDVTYRGDDEATPVLDLSVVLSGSDAVQYSSSDCWASFGSSDWVTVEPGGSTTFSECIDAPGEALSGGLIFVNESFSMDDARGYWLVP